MTTDKNLQFARTAFVLTCFFSFSTISISGQNIVDRIDSLMNSYSRNGVFSGAVLAAKKGNIIYKKAFGLADNDWNIPNTPDTKFKIASLSKPFTALLVLQLAEAGKLNLNATISDYILDYKGKFGDSITIDQLLTHTSGIISNLDPAEESIQEKLYHDLRDMARYSESADLCFKPGTGFRYSNLAYNILALIVEKVTGKRFEEVMKQNIFDRAGLYNTCQFQNERIESKLAKGYEYKLLTGLQNAAYYDGSFAVGPGGLISTVEDLFLFDKALYSDILISEDYITKIFTPYSNGHYGYGWFVNFRKVNSNGDSILVADHSGSINGFGSYMAHILNDSSFVVILKNQRADTYIDPAFAPDIGSQIISMLYGGNVALPKKSIARHIAMRISTGGADSAIAEYYRIKISDSANYSMQESELNRLGIELLFKFKMPDEALKIFELNMKQFPKSYNTYDSYAYTLREKGDFRNSIVFYRKGLEMLKKYPEANDLKTIKKDADQAMIYISEMEEKIKN